MHTRLIPFVRAAATVAVVAGTMFASAASAQVCPYNSTQGTCACPTSGAGTTCFGGQLFRSSDNSCQTDARPCAANQNWNCSTTSCVCNTASYPCGGCTAASSTVGATCSAPTGGQYTNVCGACSCPAGTTICSTSNTCVANRICPQGTTWDPCTDTCGTPNVLLSPGWIQSGFIQVNGDVKSTAGNLRMDSATAAGQGDIYVANGKAIRVDGAGVTNINIGNWGVGGTGVDMNFPATSRLCFGATCRNSWPSTTDFNPTYVNTSGAETMAGPLTVNNDVTLAGATTDLFVAGNLGVGTTTPGSKLDVQLNVAGSSGVNFRNLSSGTGAATFVRVGNDTDNISGLYRNSSTNVTDYAGANSLNLVNTGAYPLGFVTGAATRMVITAAGSVGIGTTAPTSALDVNGTATMTGFKLTTGAANGLVLVSDAAGNGTWQTTPGIGGSGTTNYVPKFTAATAIGNSQIFDNGTAVGVGTASPAAGVKLDVNGAVKGSTFTNAASPIVTGNLLIQPSAGTAAMVVGTANTTQFFQVQNNLGQAALNVDTTNMRVGVNTSAPSSTLHVNGDANISTSAGTALTVTKSGTGSAYGIYVTTAASGNAISALRAVNTGTGPGIEVNGGSNAMAALIRAGGNNPALDAAVYDHTSPNTLETVVQVRRGSTGVPAVGMGSSIKYVLEGTDGSHYGASVIGSVIASTSPWKTDFVVHPSSYSGGEQMRLTADGDLGVGTASPGAKLHVNGIARVDAGSGAGTAGLTVNGTSGTWAPSVGVSNGSQEWRMASWSDNSLIFTKVTGSTFTPVRIANNSFNNALTIGASGVGINTGSAAVNLAVGGAGTNVYATDAWIENNMHVQGNEALVAGGRGRMRVGTAWGYMGLYTDGTSTGAGNDLVLGASSGQVRVGPDGGGQNLLVSGSIGAGGQTPSSSYGIRAQGSYIGGYFYNPTYGATAYAGYYDYGLYGNGTYRGVYGYSSGGTGVYGYSGSGYSDAGVYGYSSGTLARGVQGYAVDYGYADGIYGGHFYCYAGSTCTGVYAEGRNYGIWATAYGTSGNRIGVLSNGGSGSYDFYANGAGTNYGPFTGAHEVKLSKDFPDSVPVGYVVSVTGEVQRRMDGNDTSISSTMPTVRPSSKPNDPAVLGAMVSDEASLPDGHWYDAKKDDRFGIVNALGEGRVWVTNANGNVGLGDFITTSSVPGHGQRQDDDVMHSYTLGKVTEDVDWDSVTETVTVDGQTFKAYLIGVVYVSG